MLRASPIALTLTAILVPSPAPSGSWALSITTATRPGLIWPRHGSRPARLSTPTIEESIALASIALSPVPGRPITSPTPTSMRGNFVIGIVVFIILAIVSLVVVNKGSGRIAEVGARFSLDAMPGKQMAIDADLSAGLIDEAEARQRRKDLEDESSFYGAMC